MKCKYCKFNYGSFCSKEVYSGNNDFFEKYNQTLGCSSGSLDPQLPEDVKENFATKEKILAEMKEAIKKYDERNMLVDAIFWKSIYAKIEEYLI